MRGRGHDDGGWSLHSLRGVLGIEIKIGGKRDALHN
jgi:hypothetical protein